jgi:hypothetical protein
MDELKELDVVLVNLDRQTVFFSDGVTRDICEMYDEDAQATNDSDLALFVTVKIKDDVYVLINLLEENESRPH